MPRCSAGEPDRGLTIDEIARDAGVPSSTIRLYQNKGLLPPPERRGRVGYYHQRQPDGGSDCRWHGTLNAIGFGGAALLGLHLGAADHGWREHIALHLGRPATTTLAGIEADADPRLPALPRGLMDQSTPAGYRRDEWTTALPNGFDAARQAFVHWSGHASAGIVLATRPPIEVGRTVAMAIPVGPMSLTAVAGIVAVVDEPDRFGFTYATLAHHPVDGQESFTIVREPDAAPDVSSWRSGVRRPWPPASCHRSPGASNAERSAATLRASLASGPSSSANGHAVTGAHPDAWTGHQLRVATPD